ncbi:MAG: hypothetical protein SPL05_06895 [Eubacteriales bacterium]|nr:hypothetical protein [Eubacteriales bacterium]
MKNISAEKCYKKLLHTLYKAMQDPHCFYRYHVADKEKDEDGNTRAILREQVCNKIDLKAMKESLEILQNIEKQIGEQESNGGVIILQDVSALQNE